MPTLAAPSSAAAAGAQREQRGGGEGGREGGCGCRRSSLFVVCVSLIASCLLLTRRSAAALLASVWRIPAPLPLRASLLCSAPLRSSHSRLSDMLRLQRAAAAQIRRAAQHSNTSAASALRASTAQARACIAAAASSCAIRSVAPVAAPRRCFSTAPPATPFVAPTAASNRARQQQEWCNVTEGISSKIGRNLHLQPAHPINIIKKRIAYYFHTRAEAAKAAAAAAPPSPTQTAPETFEFTLKDDLSPRVTVAQNFDSLLFTADHPGRSLSDTFYFNRTELLRTHTTAHECDLLRSGLTNFLTVGDCYRRDEIDASHYPVFHQMEGVKVFAHDVQRYNRGEDGVALVVADLKSTLDGLMRFLFGTDINVRWIPGSFPFTTPSFEMEIEFQGKWMEVLGCGVLQYPILDASLPAGAESQRGLRNGWAFGLGLERLAMILFGIPDIRLFWSEDRRFLDQFSKLNEDLMASGGQVKSCKFQPFSKYPHCFKDVSFWVPAVAAKEDHVGSSAGGEVKPVVGSDSAAAAASSSAPFHENDLCSLVREVAGDLVENVSCIDSFVHPKTKQTSKCYRIMFRSLTRNLTNEEIDVLQEQIRAQITNRLGFKLR